MKPLQSLNAVWWLAPSGDKISLLQLPAGCRQSGIVSCFLRMDDILFYIYSIPFSSYKQFFPGKNIRNYRNCQLSTRKRRVTK
jgi:hypothetical protein